MLTRLSNEKSVTVICIVYLFICCWKGIDHSIISSYLEASSVVSIPQIILIFRRYVATKATSSLRLNNLFWKRDNEWFRLIH